MKTNSFYHAFLASSGLTHSTILALETSKVEVATRGFIEDNCFPIDYTLANGSKPKKAYIYFWNGSVAYVMKPTSFKLFSSFLQGTGAIIKGNDFIIPAGTGSPKGSPFGKCGGFDYTDKGTVVGFLNTEPPPEPLPTLSKPVSWLMINNTP